MTQLKKIFNFADNLNRERMDLKLKIHWIPEFLIDLWNFMKGFLKFFLIYNFIFMPFFFAIVCVASGSMTPTCQTNEFVLSSKLGYGIKLSKIIPVKLQEDSIFDRYIYKYSDPKVGDVIAFNVPLVDSESIYTKRIVADEGQKIQFKNGVLFIDKKPVSLRFKKIYHYIENNKEYSGQLYEEILSNGTKHDAFYRYTPGSGSLDNTEEFLVPKGCVFGVGDNRHMSDDCRSLIGFIEKKDIMGKVVLVLFSNGNFFSLNVQKFIHGIRFDRCLKWMV